MNLHNKLLYFFFWSKSLSNKTCIFCGRLIKNSTKEHVLPQWLIRLTGDPKRVVNFGLNFKSNKVVRFDWLSFVVPACSECNNKHSLLEQQAKTIIEILLERKSITGKQIIILLDWLDKVRVGLWLANLKLLGLDEQVSPNFHIESRIAKKDRMLAIYPIANSEKGLNGYGSETLLFSRQPSCISLKINNIIIFNMSSDFLFSGRCGFLSPQDMELIIDNENNGLLKLNSLKATRKIKHPLIRKNIHKSSIHVYQPITNQELIKNTAQNSDKRISLANSNNIFIQKQGEVIQLADLEQKIAFENIAEHESKQVNELIAQTYEFQNFIYEKTLVSSVSIEKKKLMNKFRKLLLRDNKSYITHYKNITKT